MKIRKRYLALIALAIIPFYKFYHPENYCFGDVDLVIVFLFFVIYVIAFISAVFYNLYKISLKKELFNFRPVLITVIFLAALYLALRYHDQNLFKEPIQVYESNSRENSKLEIVLYDDNSFELKTLYERSFCVEEGVFLFKGDSLILTKNKILEGNIDFGDVYILNNTKKRLEPLYTGLPIFSKKKVTKPIVD